MSVPPGVTLDKNSPRTTIGTPDNGYGWVDESLRIKRQQAAFDARAAGVFAQDLIQVADYWKVLLGLRYDYFKGELPVLPDGHRQQACRSAPSPPTAGARTASGANASACSTSRCRR